MKSFIPDRGDVIWLDFEPTRGREIGKYRPALVLSSRNYNQKVGLVIICPISTSIRGGPAEVPIAGLDAPSVVAANLVQTLSWAERKAKLACKADAAVLKDVLRRLLPLIGAEALFADRS